MEERRLELSERRAKATQLLGAALGAPVAPSVFSAEQAEDADTSKTHPPDPKPNTNTNLNPVILTLTLTDPNLYPNPNPSNPNPDPDPNPTLTLWTLSLSIRLSLTRSLTRSLTLNKAKEGDTALKRLMRSEVLRLRRRPSSQEALARGQHAGDAARPVVG